MFLIFVCTNPKKSRWLFYNYRKYFSVILMAVVDADYCFINIDVGAYGRKGCSYVFKECPFGKKLYSNQLNLPELMCTKYVRVPSAF